jgi:predicted transcriptional regulator
MGMGTDNDGCLTEYVRRERVLASMREGAVERSRVEEIAGVSSSTAHRILSSLIDDGIVERADPGEYRLTPTGEVVAREVESFRDGVSKVRSLGTVIESADRRGVGFDTEPFKRGTVAASTPKNPYRPGERCLELLRETDQLRLLVVSTATPMFWEEKQRLVAEGRKTEIVCPEAVVETSLDTVSEETVEGLVRNMDIRVHDNPPFSVALFDDRVAVGGHADDGRLEVFADTEDDEAYAWGERVYERYRDESDGMFERFDTEEVFERIGFRVQEAFA